MESFSDKPFFSPFVTSSTYGSALAASRWACVSNHGDENKVSKDFCAKRAEEKKTIRCKIFAKVF
jgi:hypothetical protein